MSDNKRTPKRKLDQRFDKAVEKMAQTPPVSNEQLKRRKKN